MQLKGVARLSCFPLAKCLFLGFLQVLIRLYWQDRVSHMWRFGANGPLPLVHTEYIILQVWSDKTRSGLKRYGAFGSVKTWICRPNYSMQMQEIRSVWRIFFWTQSRCFIDLDPDCSRQRNCKRWSRRPSLRGALRAACEWPKSHFVSRKKTSIFFRGIFGEKHQVSNGWASFILRIFRYWLESGYKVTSKRSGASKKAARCSLEELHRWGAFGGRRLIIA